MKEGDYKRLRPSACGVSRVRSRTNRTLNPWSAGLQAAASADTRRACPRAAVSLRFASGAPSPSWSVPVSAATHLPLAEAYISLLALSTKPWLNHFVAGHHRPDDTIHSSGGSRRRASDIFSCSSHQATAHKPCEKRVSHGRW